MGLFDFVKDAGGALTDKVTGGSTDDALTRTVEVSPERINQLRGDQITSDIAKLAIEGEQVSVDVNDSIAVLTGTAPSQEALEKMVLCAGNQHGIGQVDCQLQVDAPPEQPAATETTQASAAAPASQPESVFYTVQSGDTLGKIAQEHYGAAGKYTVIFEANQPMLSDPDKIYPGQKLRIPALLFVSSKV
jgi:nucleoid-associated protein YgaU